MPNCSDGWLNRRLLPIKPLSFTEGRAEVEEWGRGRGTEGAQAALYSAGVAAGSPFGEGTLVLRLNRKRQSGKDKGTAS